MVDLLLEVRGYVRNPDKKAIDEKIRRRKRKK
jgi:hypothetical protein